MGRVKCIVQSNKECKRHFHRRFSDPPYLLADEPTGALDSKSAALMMDIFSMVRKNWQKTIVIVTHDAGVAARCDRILRLSDGRMLP